MSSAWTRSSAAEAGEPRRLRAHRQQPLGNRLRWREARRFEIVAPAERGGQALAEPSLEAERRQFRRVDRRDQGLFLARCDDTVRLRQTRESRQFEQVRLHARHVHPFPGHHDQRPDRTEPLSVRGLIRSFHPAAHGSCCRSATLARLRREEHRLEEGTQVGGVAAERWVTRQHDQQVGANQQGAATGVEGAGRGVVGAVFGSGGGQAGKSFRCARAGAAPAVHAAAAVGHGRGAAGAAGPGAGAAAWRGVGVASGVAVAERASLTLHGVLPTIWLRRRSGRDGGILLPQASGVNWRGEGPVWRTLPEHMGGSVTRGKLAHWIECRG